jgi:hypothetical protein
MPLRGEINSAIPQIQEAVGTDAQGRPVSINAQYRRLLETLWERSGGFEDETFANDAQISDLQSAIATAGERLEALEQSIQQDRAIDAALDDLQTRIAFIENLPTIQENADVAGQIDAIQFGLNSIEEQLFTAPRGIDIVTDAEVAGNAGIAYSKIAYPFQTTNGTAAINTSFGNSFTEIMQINFADVGNNHIFNFGGSSFRFRETGTGAADGACTVSWKLIANSTSGSETNSRVIAAGDLSIIEDATDPGNYHPTTDGTTGGTILPGGPLTSWSTIRSFGGGIDPVVVVESPVSGAWTFPATNLYLSLWMKTDDGVIDGYIDTTSSTILQAGGIGVLKDS